MVALATAHRYRKSTSPSGSVCCRSDDRCEPSPRDRRSYYCYRVVQIGCGVGGREKSRHPQCGGVRGDEACGNLVIGEILAWCQAKLCELGDGGWVGGVRHMDRGGQITEVTPAGCNRNRRRIDLAALDQPTPFLIVKEEGLFLM